MKNAVFRGLEAGEGNRQSRAAEERPQRYERCLFSGLCRERLLGVRVESALEIFPYDIQKIKRCMPQNRSKVITMLRSKHE